jgi:hypothetical protein
VPAFRGDMAPTVPRTAARAARGPGPGPVRSFDVPPGERHDTCLLCAAQRITPWYHEDEVCWIADCEICATPMVVWRWHGTDVPDDDHRHMMGRLGAVADEVFDGHYVDDNMRNIPDHYHAHARPRGGFFGHGFRRDRPAGEAAS